MAFKNFQQRFRGKVSSLGLYGIFQTKPSRAVNRGSFQHKSFQKQTGSISRSSTVSKSPYLPPLNRGRGSQSLRIVGSISSNSFQSTRQRSNRKSHERQISIQDTGPLLQNNASKSSEREKKERKGVDFNPYSLKEYQNTKLRSYYKLGGLGPVHIGSDQWNKKKRALRTRIEYGQKLRAFTKSYMIKRIRYN